MPIFKTAYLAKLDHIFRDLKSSRDGISVSEAGKRLVECGPNIITPKKKVTAWQVFFSQFKSPLVYILLIAGTITLFSGDSIDAAVIWGTILLNVAVGFVQEFRATNAMEALAKNITIRATVLREGGMMQVDSSKLVIGDVVIVKAGDKVSADARIFHQVSLEVDESVLTGESFPQKKTKSQIKDRRTVAERTNMLFLGTNVVVGLGHAVVVATGGDTQLGQISEFIKEEKKEKTFLQKELGNLTRTLSIILVSVTFFIFLIGLLRGVEFSQMFAEAVALAVSALPEGLPVSITVIFAIGMQRILKKKGLVRKLLATETLGRTEVICFDKTATLTEGKMEATQISCLGQRCNVAGLNLLDSPKIFHEIIDVATICNQAFVENSDDPVYRGSPTDIALLKLGAQYGLTKEKINNATPVLDSIPFDQQLKFSAALIKEKKENKIYVCGAPEEVLENSTQIMTIENGAVVRAIQKKDIERLQREYERLGASGYRVLAVAVRVVSAKRRKLDHNFKELTFLGHIVISDPLRNTAVDTVSALLSAGLRLVIVTGDHAKTAINIAKQVGLKVGKKSIITGDQLHELSDVELDKRIESTMVFARVTPSDKVRIVNSWKRKGKVVAMTGDGVNDGPALALSDIGVALGSGTEVAKEAADVVLLDDNLMTLLETIREGRTILDNIKKVVTYLLTDTFSEVVLVGVAVIFGFPLPILPAQILWVNLVEDGLPGIALALEPTEKNVMKISPKSFKRRILDQEVKTMVFIMGWLNDFALLGLFFYYHFQGEDINFTRTMVFGALAVDSLFIAFACKSLRKPIWRINLLNNKLLNVSFIVGIVVLIGAIYLPPLQTLLSTVNIGLKEWGILLMLGVVNLFGIELVKEIFIQKHYWGKES